MAIKREFPKDAKTQPPSGSPMFVTQKEVKEINTVNLGENGFLAIKCEEGTPVSKINAIREHFRTFMGGKFRDRVIIYTGDIELTKVTKEDV